MSRTRRARQRLFRLAVLVAFGAFFLVPILSMFEFSTRGTRPGTRTLESWATIPSYPDLVAAILASVELAVITSLGVLLLLVPTMIWTRLRLPWLRPILEFICLLPLTIPAIVLVVGLAPTYRWVSYYLSDSVLTLAFAYLILVLPFTYRAIDAGISAIDIKTLSEAARSLGAGWITVMWRIIVPNMRSALLNAGLLSVALVLGEYTIANLLSFTNLQVAIYHLGRANAGVSIAVAVASLLFAFLILTILAFVGRPPSLVALAEDA